MSQLTALKTPNIMNGSTHKGNVHQQGDVKWEGERNGIFRQFSNPRWKLTSFTVLGFVITGHILETAGLPILAELIGDYTNSWSFFRHQFHQMCRECVCVCFCTFPACVFQYVDGWRLVAAGGFKHLRRHSCSERGLCSVCAPEASPVTARGLH